MGNLANCHFSISLIKFHAAFTSRDSYIEMPRKTCENNGHNNYSVIVVNCSNRFGFLSKLSSVISCLRYLMEYVKYQQRTKRRSNFPVFLFPFALATFPSRSIKSPGQPNLMLFVEHSVSLIIKINIGLLSFRSSFSP